MQTSHWKGTTYGRLHPIFTLKLQIQLHTMGALVYTEASCGRKWDEMGEDSIKSLKKSGEMEQDERLF